MKKKIMIPIIIVIAIILIVVGVLLFTKKYNYDDENTLYFVKFKDTILRFEHIDSVMPQNQIVAVQKSINNGKTFETITEGQVIVSMEPKFVFLNEKIGFAVKKTNNIKDNGKYYGMYVTLDGGKTFNQSEITYDNPNIEILTIEDVPFYENDKLKLHCSIYQTKDDGSGYETVDLYFITDDDGLTWYLENDTKELILNIKRNTLTNKGATFIIKNTSGEEYAYGPAYTIEKFENQGWKELSTLTGDPLTWNSIVYSLKAHEEKELIIDWSLGYGELTSGRYRIVKNSFRKKNSPESRSYSVYAEFEIPIKVIAGTANTIQVEKNNLQDGNKFNKYLERDGKKVYIASNIKEVYYDDVKTKHVLKDFIQNTYQTIDDSIKHLINFLLLFSELRDGGTRIYKSQEYDITIVKCNTIAGNKDYYIGDYSMNFDSNSMCKG